MLEEHPQILELLEKHPKSVEEFLERTGLDKKLESARISGLQAAKDKEIAALRNANEDLQRRGVAALSALEEQTKEQLAAKDAELAELKEKFQADIDAKSAALDEAKAEAEQLRSKCAEAEKALSETKAALDAEIERYRAQVGGALQQPDGNGGVASFPDAVNKFGYAAAARKFPGLHEAFIRSHKKGA